MSLCEGSYRAMHATDGINQTIDRHQYDIGNGPPRTLAAKNVIAVVAFHD